MRNDVDFLDDDFLGLLGLALAIAKRLLRDRVEIVDVVEVDVFDFVEALVEIARHAEIDQKHRPILALANDRLDIMMREHRLGHRQRPDQDVGDAQVGLVVFEWDRGAAEIARERDRAIESARGDEQRLDAERLQMARGQLRHLARAHQHRGLVASVSKICPARLTATELTDTEP